MSDPSGILVENEHEHEYELDPETVVAVAEALDRGDRDAVIAEIRDLHVADVADLLEQLDSEHRRRFVELAWDEVDPEVLVEVDEGVRDELIEILSPTRIAEAAKEFDTDDVVHLVEDLDVVEQQEILEALEPEERVAVVKALSYPEESAGRLMQSEFVKAPPFWTVGQMIDFLRDAEELPEQFYDVIIVDPAMRPLGKVPLGRLLASRRPVPLESIMDTDITTFHAVDPQEDVAYAFRKYHLISAPVVDDAGRVVGVITIDDAMEILDEEAEQDILRLGSVGDEEISDDVWETARNRFRWLFANLLTAILASLVIGLFEETIARAVALAVLMPIVASMGGIAGTQTMTVAVRALATRDLTAANAARVIWRELTVGALNGVGFAVIMGLVAWFWFDQPIIGAVIAVAMVVNLVAAALAGILVPLALERIGVDPALASGTFVTTVTDVVGFFAFLGLASVLLL